jgi:hypothetical protein
MPYSLHPPHVVAKAARRADRLGDERLGDAAGS